MAEHHIYLVSNDEDLSASFSKIMEANGAYAITRLGDGKEALRQLRKEGAPDLIVAEFDLPEMDGLQLCYRIRNSDVTKNIPFIFITEQKEQMTEGLKAGADDFISKPLQDEEVGVKIEALFRRMDKSRQLASEYRGSLGEYRLDEVLRICHQRSISGELILQNQNTHGKITLSGGDIVDVQLPDMNMNEALDELRNWEEGLFVIHTEQDMLHTGFRKQQTDTDASKDDKGLNRAVQISEGVWWVGYFDGQRRQLYNVYLRRFQNEDRKINALIDPGSALHFKKLAAKIADVIGNIAKINLYAVHSPFPESVINSMFIRNANPKAVMITSREHWRHIRHLDIPEKSVKLVEQFKDFTSRFITGHKLQFIEIPFCPHAGSFMTYDPDQRVLFSGMLFSSGKAAQLRQQLYYEDIHWRSMQRFHFRQMPGSRELRNALALVQQLQPRPLLIAPMFGPLLRGSWIDTVLERLLYLPTRMDSENSSSEKLINDYQSLCNEMIVYSHSHIPIDQVKQKLRSNPAVMGLTDVQEGEIVRLYGHPQKAFEQMILALCEGESVEVRNQIKSEAMQRCHTNGLPAPKLNWEGEQTLTDMPSDLFENNDSNAP